MRKRVISFLYSIHAFKVLLWLFHVVIGKNYLRVSNKNRFDSTTANIYKNQIDLRGGKENEIRIGYRSDLHNSDIRIKGNRNKICIGEDSFVNGLKIIVEGDDNQIYIGDRVFVLDDTRLYVVDGSKLVIGDGCMLSDHIEIRTTDNHSIYSGSTKKRINPEQDVILHSNVWIGMRSILLKGTEIAQGCIVGAGSVVTGRHTEEQCVIAGNPAKEIKRNIVWTMERKDSIA